MELNSKQMKEYKHDLIKRSLGQSFCTSYRTLDKTQDYQEIFICKTCQLQPNSQKKVPICACCAYDCHKGHQVISIWTKRMINCMCGTQDDFYHCKYKTNDMLTKLAALPPVDQDDTYKNRFCKCKYDGTITSIWSVQCQDCCDWVCYDCSPVVKTYMHMESGKSVIQICPNCVNKNKNQLNINNLFLKQLFDKHDQGQVNLSKYSKYLKLQQITDSVKTKIDNLDTHLQNSKIEDVGSLEFFFEFEFLENLCKCKKCLDWLKNSNTDWIMDATTISPYSQDEIQKMKSDPKTINDVYNELNIDETYDDIISEQEDQVALLSNNDQARLNQVKQSDAQIFAKVDNWSRAFKQNKPMDFNNFKNFIKQDKNENKIRF